MSNKSNPVPATSRRSARQQRLASREANRQLARAGTRGSGSGGDLGGLLLWTVVAIVVGAAVIGGAWMLTRESSGGSSLASPMAPGKTTPASIPSAGRTLGNPDAPVTIDLYSDFRCTGCFAFAMDLEPGVVKDYVATGKAKLVYHDFIVIDGGGNTESRDAANAARCAADQGKFWLFHDWLYANQSARELPGYFTLDRLVYMGKAAGLNMATFEPCVREGKHVGEVTAEQAGAPAGISSTPTIFIDGNKVENSVDPRYLPTAADLKTAIEAALNPTASPSASASASATASPS